MTNAERIEKLKDPKQVQAFGLLAQKFQAVLEKAGKRNCICLTGTKLGPEWTQLGPESSHWATHLTYILKPNYEPEPEYDKVKVLVAKGVLQCGGVRIDCLCINPNFAGFWSKDGQTHYNDAYVATAIYEGVEVEAWFRKE